MRSCPGCRDNTQRDHRHADPTRSGQAAERLPPVLGQALRDRAVSADEPRRDGRAGLGFVRRDHRHRRRVRRSPELRHGGDRPHAGGAGLSRRHHRAARLVVGRAVQGAGPTEPVLRRHRRQHGFDDQPLHRRPQDPQRRRLHAGRRRRQAARPRVAGLCPALQGSVQRRADRARRHRGLAAPHRALRLLAGQGAALDPGRQQGGLAAVRQCRARDRRDRAPPGQARAGGEHHRCARHRVHGPFSDWAGARRASSRSTRPRSICPAASTTTSART